MKGTVQDNNVGARYLPVMPEAPCQFDRRFIGLCPRIAKEHVFHTGGVSQ
jgi:hypothetical protein